MEQDANIVIEMQGKRYALSELPKQMLYVLLQQIEQQYRTGCIDVSQAKQHEAERKQQIASYVNRIRSLGYTIEEVSSIIDSGKHSAKWKDCNRSFTHSPNVEHTVENQSNYTPMPSVAEDPDLPSPTTPIYNTSAGRLYIITRTGQRIQMPTSRRTLLEGIRQAGFSRVYAMQIPYMNGRLVDIKPNPFYPKFTFHEGEYYITIANSDVPRMLRLAERISAHLHLDWTVGIVEK